MTFNPFPRGFDNHMPIYGEDWRKRLTNRPEQMPPHVNDNDLAPHEREQLDRMKRPFNPQDLPKF